MKILRYMATAVMLYTRIPVPGFVPDEDDMGHAIMFLPVAGLIIAVPVYPVMKFLPLAEIPATVCAVLCVLLPIVITGGFHIDGFMDTVDALRSYQPKERKLEIMHDPHTGSFAVIGLVTVILFMMAALELIFITGNPVDTGIVVNVCGIFVISRTVTALTSLHMKKARDNGLLVKETAFSGRGETVMLSIWLIIVLFVMITADMAAAIVTVLAFAVFTFVYRHITTKNFGGITGDTAGYFVTVSETVAICTLAVAETVIRLI